MDVIYDETMNVGNPNKYILSGLTIALLKDTGYFISINEKLIDKT